MRRFSYWLVFVLALFVATATQAQTTQITAKYFGMTQLLQSNPTAQAAGLKFGVGRLLDTPCNWPAINTSSGTFTYSASCDAQLDAIVAAGAQPDYVDNKTPIWATTGGSGTNGSPPSDVDSGGAIITAMVNSLVAHLTARHPGAHFIAECRNEADLSSNWNGTMLQLVHHCTAFKNAFHAADPSSTVIVWGPSGSTLNTSNVHLYSDGNDYAHVTGAAASMDGINIHPYEQSCSTYCDGLATLLASMSKVAALTAVGQPLAGMPVIFSEGNWGGAPGPSGATTLNSSYTDAKRSAFLGQEYVISLRNGISGFYWYAYDSHADNLLLGFGSLSSGNPASSAAPNGAATTYKTLYTWLVGATYSGTSLSCSTDGNGTVTCPLLSSPVAGSSASLIYNPNGNFTATAAAIYTKMLNDDGTQTTIANNQVTATPRVALLVTPLGNSCQVVGGS